MRGKRRLRRRSGRKQGLRDYTWRPEERLPLPGSVVDHGAERWHP